MMRVPSLLRRGGGVVLTWILAASLGLLVASAPVQAHSFSLTDAVLVVKADGQFHLDLTSDLDALALGVSAFVTVDSEASSDGTHEGETSIEALANRLEAMEPNARQSLEARLIRLYLTRVTLRVDGTVIPHRVDFPERSDRTEDSAQSGSDSFFGTTARLSGRLPDGGNAMTVAVSRSFRSVHLTILQQSAETIRRQVMGPGERSQPIELHYRGADASERDEDSASRDGGWWAILMDYIRLGFVHIIPLGLDHIAFVFGLCLLGLRWQSLALWVSAFTVGHTVSLAAAASGWLVVAPQLVEPLIGLSIGWVAVRAMLNARNPPAPQAANASPWSAPWSELWLIGCLGLLHGSGFGGALSEVGLPRDAWLSGLIGFNIGVEVGQLVVLAVASVLLHLCFRFLPQRRLVVALSVVLLGLSVFWTSERVGLI